MLNGALEDVPQNRKELCAYLKKYISIQKEHMNREEAHVYPTLNSTLTEDDWKNINTELAYIEDPLFGDKAEKSYQGLFQHIVS